MENVFSSENWIVKRRYKKQLNIPTKFISIYIFIYSNKLIMQNIQIESYRGV